MRKGIALGAFLLAASFAVAEPERVSLGFLDSFAPLEGNYQLVSVSGVATNIANTYETFGARVFLDFTYGEASVAYKAPITQFNTTATASGISLSQAISFSMSVVDIRLVGKYPFHTGFLTLFPLFGVAGDFCLSGNSNGTDFTNDDKRNLSPWWIVAGVGGDFAITQGLFARIELTGAYDVTSKYAASFYNNSNYSYSNSSGWEVEIAAGIGFTI